MPPLSGMQALGPTSVQPLQPNKGFFGNAREFLFGQSPQQITQNRFTPQQMGIYQQLAQQGLQRGMQNLDFGPIAEQARRGLQEKTIPSIAERFAGSNSLSSSAFQNQLSQASGDLEGRLAALQSQFQLQQQPFFNQMLQFGLQPQFDQAITEPSGGLLGSLMGTEAGTKAVLGGVGQAGSALGSAFMQALPYISAFI